MITYFLRKRPKELILLMVLSLLSACSPTDSVPEMSVASAYETAGMIAVEPYTRSIFSTHNF